MQAIVTKYLPATNYRGSRIKASCERGSITISYPFEKSGEECHRVAVDALLERFVAEDAERFDPNASPWRRAYWICGALPISSPHTYAFVSCYQKGVAR